MYYLLLLLLLLFCFERIKRRRDSRSSSSGRKKQEEIVKRKPATVAAAPPVSGVSEYKSQVPVERLRFVRDLTLTRAQGSLFLLLFVCLVKTMTSETCALDGKQ